MSITRSLRLNDSLINNIEIIAEKKNISFNKLVANLLNEYNVKFQESGICIEDEIYYPIHLTDSELILIMDEFISNHNMGHNCHVKVRKDSGGKGIDFQINFIPELKESGPRRKRFSFTINSNWKIENAFEHWLEDKFNNKKKYQEFCRTLDYLKIQTIQNIIEDNKKHNIKPEVNSALVDNTWKVIFERKYPNIKEV